MGSRLRTASCSTPASACRPTTAQVEPRLSTGSEASNASHEPDPGGTGGSTYPSTAFQNFATAGGFAQSKVTCTCFTLAVDAE
jgi:hypothetical protein